MFKFLGYEDFFIFRPQATEGLQDSTEEMRINRVHTMHVQGVSHWAPANIGPYSQAVRVSCSFNYN